MAVIFLITSFLPIANSQGNLHKGKTNPSTFVDKNGILRWTSDNSPLTLFGVNYTTPFAHSYRVHGYLKIDREKAIDADVYHLARLGFDAFRVHVWDCEISDTLGNLLENDHLRLFDYLLEKLKERNIKILLTPIAYWGDGYPEPDEKTPGFSSKYGKAKCLVNPEAIKAQENYLSQFVNHINPYTGIKYNDDPDIIAFEVCNEPHHEGTAESVTEFINRMVKAIRNTGCKKPVFYNVSHNIYLGDAYFKADIQGGTFQWYPSGLVRGHELRGNFLPNVADYIIPYDNNKLFMSMARVVYEYDAADIGRSYIHPYMAKSFREAGFQFATQFAYDPLYMAYANTDYQTHYMNMVYAPQKALSLKIAGEVFHKLPTGRNTADYPVDTLFDCFRVSYKSDLSEMVSDEKFMYTNNTSSVPPHPENLKHIVGYGSSSLVSYEGCGDYFLDQLEKGVWRLEVLPDAVWVRDPFERASLKKEVSVIAWNEWPMMINLPGLGNNFNIKGLNTGNDKNLVAIKNKFLITPGTYLLSGEGKMPAWKSSDHWENILIGEFVAPPSSSKRTYVIHEPFEEITEGAPVNIRATVVGTEKEDSVELLIRGRFRQSAPVIMKRITGYTYGAILPQDLIHEGILRYNIIVKRDGKSETFPAGI